MGGSPTCSVNLRAKTAREQPTAGRRQIRHRPRGGPDCCRSASAPVRPSGPARRATRSARCRDGRTRCAHRDQQQVEQAVQVGLLARTVEPASVASRSTSEGVPFVGPAPTRSAARRGSRALTSLRPRRRRSPTWSTRTCCCPRFAPRWTSRTAGRRRTAWCSAGGMDDDHRGGGAEPSANTKCWIPRASATSPGPSQTVPLLSPTMTALPWVWQINVNGASSRMLIDHGGSITIRNTNAPRARRRRAIRPRRPRRGLSAVDARVWVGTPVMARPLVPG